MKKLIVLALIGSQFLVSCRTGEVVAGTIGVGVGIGLGRYYDRHHGHHHGHHHGGGRHGRWNSDLETMVANSDAKKFADRYGIRFEAAKKIQMAFAGLPDSGLASFDAIGLGKADLKAIAKHNLPSADSIKQMAEKLDMSEAQTRDLLVNVNRDFQARSANVNSYYWQSCMEGGQWSTPQNSSCQQANWSGCSPATGASLCY
jgi:hypothetical protein